MPRSAEPPAEAPLGLQVEDPSFGPVYLARLGNCTARLRFCPAPAALQARLERLSLAGLPVAPAVASGERPEPWFATALGGIRLVEALRAEPEIAERARLLEAAVPLLRDWAAAEGVEAPRLAALERMGEGLRIGDPAVPRDLGPSLLHSLRLALRGEENGEAEDGEDALSPDWEDWLQAQGLALSLDWRGDRGVYRLGALLGDGVEARVYRATAENGAAVAFRWSRKPDEAARYEVRLQALQGPGFPAVVDHGVRDGRPFLVLSPCGEPARDWLRARPPAGERHRLARNLLQVLGHLHRRGAAHGDLALRNLVVLPGAGALLVDPAAVASIAEDEAALLPLLQELLGGEAGWLLARAGSARELGLRLTRFELSRLLHRWRGPLLAALLLLGLGAGLVWRALSPVASFSLAGGELLVRRTELSQAEWAALMGRPAPLDCDTDLGLLVAGADLPAVCLSWCDAARAANALSRRDGLRPAWPDLGPDCAGGRRDPEADGWRFPTETEHTEITALIWPDGPPDDPCARGNLADHEAFFAVPAVQQARLAWSCEGGRDDVAGPAPVRDLRWWAGGLYHWDGNAAEWLDERDGEAALHSRLSYRKDIGATPARWKSGRWADIGVRLVRSR